MKFKLISLVLGLCFACQLPAQEFAFTEQTTTEEAIDKLKETLEAVESTKGLFSLFSGEITIIAGEESEVQALTENELELLVGELNLREIHGMLDIINQAKELELSYESHAGFKQFLAKPYSAVAPNIQPYHVEELVYEDNNDRLRNFNYRVKTIYYADGGMDDLSHSPISIDSIPSMVQIDSLYLLLSFDVPISYSNYSFSTDKPAHVINGDSISILSIDGKRVEMCYKPNNVDDICNVLGLTDNGFYTKTVGSSNSPMDMESTNKFFDKVGSILKENIEKLEQGLITDIPLMEQQMVNQMREYEEDTDDMGQRLIYMFSREPKELVLQFASYENIEIELALVKDSDDEQNAEQGRWVAKDTRQDKYGLVDFKGNWQIEPNYDGLREFLPNMYTGSLKEDPSALSFIYNEASKSLEPKPYILVGDMNDYILIKDAEENYGVMDYDSKMLIAPAYSEIELADNNKMLLAYTYIDSLNEQVEVYSLKGKKILPVKYDGVSINDECIKASRLLGDKVELTRAC